MLRRVSQSSAAAVSSEPAVLRSVHLSADCLRLAVGGETVKGEGLIKLFAANQQQQAHIERAVHTASALCRARSARVVGVR